MALSNIFREPRREITEQSVGFCIAVPTLALWGWSTYWFGTSGFQCPAFNESPCWVGAFLTGPAIVIVALILVAATHDLGEAACDALQRLGIHLRPRQRY